MEVKNLRHAKKVTLFRVENGWIVSDEDSLISAESMFVYESTDSMLLQLKEIIGESGWRIPVPQKVEPVIVPRKHRNMPERGPGGKFLPNSRKIGVDAQ